MVGLRVFDVGALVVWLVWFFRLRDDDDDGDDDGRRGKGGGSEPEEPSGPGGLKLPLPESQPWHSRRRDHARRPPRNAAPDAPHGAAPRADPHASPLAVSCDLRSDCARLRQRSDRCGPSEVRGSDVLGASVARSLPSTATASRQAGPSAVRVGIERSRRRLWRPRYSTQARTAPRRQPDRGSTASSRASRIVGRAPGLADVARLAPSSRRDVGRVGRRHRSRARSAPGYGDRRRAGRRLWVAPRAGRRSGAPYVLLLVRAAQCSPTRYRHYSSSSSSSSE